MTFVGVCKSFLNGQEEKESSKRVPRGFDEADRIFQESVIPAARQQTGFPAPRCWLTAGLARGSR
jgi:hypothetical protein